MAPVDLRLVGGPGLTLAADVDVILVPGINTKKTEDWRIFSDRQWLPQSLEVRLWTFDHHLQLNDSFSWARLREPAGRLCEDCRELVEQQNCDPPCPILFVAHSLGGSIVKQALVKLNTLLYQSSRLHKAIVGIVYMSTLHGADSPERLREKGPLLVKSLYPDLSKQSMQKLADESHLLEYAASDYDGLNLHISTLSIFEQKETRLPHSSRWRNRHSSQILVDRNLAKVNATSPFETCLGFDTDHQNTCNWMTPIQNESQAKVAKQWVASVLVDAAGIVKSRSSVEKRPISTTVEQLSLCQSFSQQNTISGEPKDQMASRATSTKTVSTKRESIINLASTELSIPVQTQPELTRAFPQQHAYLNNPTPRHTLSDITLDKEVSLEDKPAIVPIPSRLMESITQRPASLPCFMVEERLRNKSFFGRETQLQQLDNALLPYETPGSSTTVASEVRYVAMYGLPGVGKSDLAARYAFTREKKFDAVFWIRADTVAKMDFDFSKIAKALNLLDPEDEAWGNASVNRELSRAWLANPTKLSRKEDNSSELVEASWLLIFDNASNPRQLDDYWPLLGVGSILITTRDPILTREFSDSVIIIELKPFNDEEAAIFLRELVFENKEGSATLAKQIAKRLGGHPLALAHMAGVIRDTMMSLDEFLEIYENMSNRQKLLELSDSTYTRHSRGSIASMLAADQLSHQGGAKILLELSSMLDPDGIPESILTDFDICAESFDEYPANRVDYLKARAKLLRASLLQRHADESDRKLFSMHRVVQDVVRAGLDPKHMQKLMRCAAKLLAAAWSVTQVADRDMNRHWEHRADLYPHVVSLKELFENNAELERAQSSLDLVHIVSEAGWWQFERGTVGETKPLLESALTMCESSETLQQETESQKPGVWFDTLSDIRFGLGAFANEGNDGASCLEHNKLLLEMRLWACERKGAPDLRLAIAYNQIGTGWMMDHDFGKAVKAFQSSIETYKSLENYWKCTESVPVVNLGQAHWLLGDLEAASKILEEGLKDREEIFGFMDTHSFRTGRFLHALGNVRWDQASENPDEYEKFMEESESYHRRALVQYNLTIKNNHRTADVCHRVAKHCIRRKNLSDASSLLDQALKIWGADPSRYVPELARTTFLKAKVARFAGDGLGAQALVREAVSLRNTLPNIEPKIPGALEEKDFDALVTFWSK